MAAEQIYDNDLDSRIERRNDLLKGIDAATIQKAWFTLSHLLLEDGAKVIDMGCDDGAMTYAMAVLNPKVKFLGLDKSKRQVNKAKERFQLHNLDFKIGDAGTDLFEPESVDAIINSYVLHQIYSGSRYNDRIVSDTLRKHFRMLKKGGTMFIRDYARPPPEQYVLMEMPDVPSTGNDLAKMSEPDLLVWYSEHARPRQDAGCGGFFLEELPPRFPRTRLFRLPYKWMYEFVMRKDDRTHWETELPVEYTFFTMQDFRRELRMLGARVQYSAPYWDDELIDKKFEGKFRLYESDGAQLGYPPTCFIAVAVKMAERKSLHVHERRPASAEESKLVISAMRDEKTGRIVDIASRQANLCDVIPYRIDEEGRLKIYLCDGVVRSIVNAVPRSGTSLDDRRWSGHMIEPISVDIETVGTPEERDVKNTVLFARDYLGLKPQSEAVLELGPDYYPEPGFIDERIFTFYLRVEETKGQILPKKSSGPIDRFQAKGALREMDAQQILDSITVGMIPNAQLELQILALFQKLKIKPENWTSKQVNFQAGRISGNKNLRLTMDIYGNEAARFRSIKGTSGELKPIHSIFVEEGQVRGAIAGLSSQDVDFIVHDSKTVNTAVVIPLTKGLKNDVHAGFLLDHMPVPQRHEGNGLTISVPSFNMPADITNMRAAKKFIADKYSVMPEMVIKLGESYFSHIGMTPQKIYPFAVTVPPSWPAPPGTAFAPFYQLRLLRKHLSKDTHFMVVMARAYRYLNDDLKLDAQMRVDAILKERFAMQQPEWSAPLDYRRAPSLPPPREIEDTEAFEDMPEQDQFDEPQEQDLTIPDQHPEKPLVAQKPVPNVTPLPVKKMRRGSRLKREFEEELEEFLEELEQDNTHKPRPEKW